MFGIRAWKHWRRLGTAGTAAIEFALTAPLIGLLVMGVADYGAMDIHVSQLIAASRAGAEHGRATINSTLSSGQKTTIETEAQTLVTGYMSFPSDNAPSAAATLVCYCAFNFKSTTCPTVGVQAKTCPAANPQILQFMKVTATINPYRPLFTVAGFVFPSKISAITILRAQ